MVLRLELLKTRTRIFDETAEKMNLSFHFRGRNSNK